jgi:translation elongation factor EF-1beta
MAASEKGLSDVLAALGDPSGRQDAEYWNDWFNVVGLRHPELADSSAAARNKVTDDPSFVSVSTNEGMVRSFEWYCDVSEVEKVLKYHLRPFVPPQVQSEQAESRRFMIHPGSGTSLLPLRLGQSFPHHDHVVVDVSQVAIDQIKIIHEAELERTGNNRTGSLHIEYLLTDVLSNDTLLRSHGDASFDAWIDKGFVDAVFPNDDEVSQTQALRLFREANRVLTDQGVAIVVSLAEPHSMNLVVSAFCHETDGGRSWHPDLHVWELQPISGDLRPFAFVLTKSQASGMAKYRIVWHFRSDSEKTMVKEASAPTQVLDIVNMLIQESRVAFAKQQRMRNISSSVSLKNERLFLAVLEIKPFDTDTNLVELAHRIRAATWTTTTDDSPRSFQPQWCSGGHVPSSLEVTSPQEEIVPIGFGISKLVLRCILPQDDLEPFVSILEERGGSEDFDNAVGSVDIDWTQSVPISTWNR